MSDKEILWLALFVCVIFVIFLRKVIMLSVSYRDKPKELSLDNFEFNLKCPVCRYKIKIHLNDVLSRQFTVECKKCLWKDTIKLKLDKNENT